MNHQKLSQWKRKIFNNLTLNFWLNEINPLWTLNELSARVVNIEKPFEGFTILTLKTNSRAQAFIAGQHVNISVEINGVWHTRSYSPIYWSKTILKLAIKQKEHGTSLNSGNDLDSELEKDKSVSKFINQNLKNGDILKISLPFGDVHYDSLFGAGSIQSFKKWFLFAGGIGITPIFSILKAIKKNKELNPILYSNYSFELIYCERELEKTPLLNELINEFGNQDWLHISFYLSRSSDNNEKLIQTKNENNNFQKKNISIYYQKFSKLEFERGLLKDQSGLLNHDQLNAVGDKKINVMSCGSRRFNQFIRDLFPVEFKNFYCEDLVQLQKMQDKEKTNEHVIRIKNLNVYIKMDGSKSILENLESHKLKVKSGCRMGICKTCTTHKITGDVYDSKDQMIRSERDQLVQLCTGYACSDLEIQLEV